MAKFDCIAVTCASLKWATAIEAELAILRNRNIIPTSTKTLTVEDPANNIGSGAATLNALLVVTELLSADSGYTVISPDVLTKSRILVLHHGREYAYEPCGKAFMALPNKVDGTASNLENLLRLVSQMQESGPPGVWICSTDMVLSCSETAINWETVKGGLLVCCASDPQYATGHGAVMTDPDGNVSSILYCGTLEALHNYTRPDGTVLVVSGIVFLSAEVAESLLALQAKSPLDSCTYMGVDSGAEPMQMSLFFDLLVAMTTGVSRESFENGSCGRWYDHKFCLARKEAAQRARSLIWEELSWHTLKPYVLEGGTYQYLSNDTTAEEHSKRFLGTSEVNPFLHSALEGCMEERSKCALMNTLLRCPGRCHVGDCSVLKDCCLEAADIFVGQNCYVNGVTLALKDEALHIPDGACLLQYEVWLADCAETFPVAVAFGARDNITVSCTDRGFTIFNRPLTDFCEHLSISMEDLWSLSEVGGSSCLLTAKLFTVGEESLQDALWLCSGKSDKELLTRWRKKERLSLAEIMACHDLKQQFSKRWDTFIAVASSVIKKSLTEGSDVLITPYMSVACACSREAALMDALDSVAESEAANKDVAVACRVFSCIADYLGTMAGKSGGLRSGPGGNKAWTTAFHFLEEGDTHNGSVALKQERLKWMDRSDRMIRAARHYEGALQVLIRRAVLTAEQFVVAKPTGEGLAYDVWAVAECPARMDLFGGWTDTPPICYELGGSVINVAVLVDGQRPIGAKARRLTEPHIILTLLHHNVPETITIRNMADLLDYNQPGARGALLKACLVGSNVVQITDENLSLSKQLKEQHGGGIELDSWSNLPQGSGLGTSSILASAIVAALWAAVGWTFDKSSLVHCVLRVEQLLTTGGGWQDQVGGVTGGLVRGYSNPGLPLRIHIEAFPLTKQLLAQLSAHFVLLYTGKVRLAKNLLQTVIRNWYTRDSKVIACFRELLHQCETSVRDVFLSGDFEAIGKSLGKYWSLKKVLAVGCEPEFVRRLMDLLSPHVHGQLLLGAGGGGFLCALMKQPHMVDSVRKLLANAEGMERVTVHHVDIDLAGLRLCVRGNVIPLH
ncbi:L-fucose kinase [Ixodes scapularis]